MTYSEYLLRDCFVSEIGDRCNASDSLCLVAFSETAQRGVFARRLSPWP